MKTIINSLNQNLNFNDNIMALAFTHKENIMQKQQFNDTFLGSSDHIIIPIEMQLIVENFSDFEEIVSQHFADYSDFTEFTEYDVTSAFAHWLFSNESDIIKDFLGLLILYHNNTNYVSSSCRRTMNDIIDAMFKHFKLDYTECKIFKAWQKFYKYFLQFDNFVEIAESLDITITTSHVCHDLKNIHPHNLPMEKWINILTLIKGKMNRKPHKYDMVITTNFYDMLSCSCGDGWSSCLRPQGSNAGYALMLTSMPHVCMVGLIESGTYQAGENKWKRRSFVCADVNSGSFTIGETYPCNDAIFCQKIKQWFADRIDFNQHQSDYEIDSFIGILEEVSSYPYFSNGVKMEEWFGRVQPILSKDVLHYTFFEQGELYEFY